ncbi:MAG: hypothetical protein KF744_15725 [Taibaiella sp.]|nr:hypothetical protein [Taibaiella sp.]
MRFLNGLSIGVFLLLVMVLPLTSSFGQSKLRIQHYNVEDGLSQSSVYSIFQDSYGFIWMATGDGLNRFDGKDFVPYKSKLINVNKGLLKDRNINSVIFEDVRHDLWFSADEGVYCMHRRTGQTEVCINKNVVGYSGSVIGTDGNNVWVPVTGKGIYRLDAVTKATEIFPFTDSSQTHEVVPVNHGLYEGDVIWIVDAKGVLKWEKGTKRDKRILWRNDARRICRISADALAVSADDGVLIYDIPSGAWRFIKLIVPGKAHTPFSGIVRDSISRQLFVAERDGGAIVKIDLITWKQELLQFQDHPVVRMFIDRSQNLWVGTDGAGAYVVDIKKPKFSCYIPSAGLSSGAMIKSIYCGDNGAIWVGLYGKGVVRYNPDNGSEQMLKGLPSMPGAYYNCLFKDSSGDIIVAMNDTIAWLDEESGEVKAECVLPYTGYMGPALPVAFSIVEWRKGVFLVGANHGVYYLKKEGLVGKSVHVRGFGSIELGGWIYGFYRDKDNLYIGRRNGFAKVSLTADTIPHVVDNGLRDMPVRHFYKSKNTNLLWLATEQGLVAYDEQTHVYTVFDEDDGMANSFVYAILPQNDSVLWISTNKGISSVSIRYRKTGVPTAVFKNYSAKDGLQSNEFNSGAYFAGADGTLFFGGISGINWFKPQNIVQNSYLAQPALTGIYVDDTLYARDTTMFISKIILPYRRNTVSLSFRALEYTLPEQNRYAYKLEGQDNEWVYTTNDKVRFAKLEPGHYTFLLKVTNNDGLWNERPLAMEIVINPPYWRTWWFRLLLVVAGASAIAGMLRYYTQQRIKSRMLAMERQYALHMERLRISKDVHDDIGSGLSRISLLSEIASKKMYADERAARDMRNISSLSKELVDNMRDLIWVLNPENTTLDSLVSRMREYTVDYLDGIGVSLVLEFPDAVPAVDISREVQRNIFSTVKEAINNSVKHAHAQTIWLTVGLDDELFSIVVKDDGVGFDMAKPGNGGNGLRNMRYRIESVGGRFLINSEVGKGTTTYIEMPIDRLIQHTT